MDRIANLPNIDIVHPFSADDKTLHQELSPRTAAQRLASIDEELNVDVVICRGSKVSAHVANSTRLAAKSWLYMTDIPHPVSRLESKRLKEIRTIAAACKRLFAQTRDAQSYLEAIAPEACGKTVLLNPMVPDAYYNTEFVNTHNDQLRLVYSGKFAKDWRTLEMTELPNLLNSIGIPSQLTMIGDKFQTDLVDSDWSSRMQLAIVGEGINWKGGVARDTAAETVAQHDISMSWRSQKMDDSFELSTKVLESAAMGVPPLVNRNAAHEELFGSDYPLYIEKDDISEVISVLSSLGGVSNVLRQTVRDSVSNYSISKSAERLECYFSVAEADYSVHACSTGKIRVVLAGHDFKFAGELVDILSARSDIELRFDHWTSLHTHDVEKSQGMRDWADVVICEWAGPNAVWYSQNKREDQKLIVRLHMFELNGPWLVRINVDAIDTLICVSELYEERVRALPGWGDAKIRVIANAVNCEDLCRPKLKGSQFRLGLVGIVPIRKRLDRAVDLMSRLLELDERFTLHVRGRMPWEYSYEWKKSTQQMAYREIFAGIGADDRLLKSIVFEPFGADMGSWFRKIGFILSPSSDESFHLAPAEGMAGARSQCSGTDQG